MTELRAKHALGVEGGVHMGIDGNAGKIVDMRTANIWDPISVKLQTFKTAIESACMLLRIDDIVSGIKRDKRSQAGRGGENDPAEQETFGDNRDG
jgi:T-complex protein 1 subunit gamma